MSYLKITWKKSAIGYNERQRRVVKALGLQRLNHSVFHHDSPTIKGMIKKISHLLEIEEIAEPTSTTKKEHSKNKS